ncbi:MAG TPA: hypothetical protein VF625_10785, partial [Longimicrobium sp.]
MPLREQVKAALDSYPTSRSLLNWRSSESATAIEVLRELISGRVPVDDRTLQAHVDFFVTGASQISAVGAGMRKLKHGGRLWSALNNIRTSAPLGGGGAGVSSSSSSSSSPPIRSPLPTPTSPSPTPSTSGSSSSALIRPPLLAPSPSAPPPSSSSSSSSSTPRMAPPPLDPSRSMGLGSSRMAAMASTQAASAISSKSLERDIGIARDVLRSPEMRAIVVMDPELYRPSKAAIKAMEAAQHSAYASMFRASMLTLPK